MAKGSTISTGAVFKALWRGVLPFKSIYIAGVLSFTIGIVIGILIPLFYKQFFDAITSGAPRADIVPVLIHIITLIALFHIANWLFYRGATLINNHVQAKVMARLRQNAFNYMLLHSHNFFASNFTGSLIQRVGRFSRAFERLSDSLVYNIIPLFVTIVGSVIVTWTTKPLLAVVLLIWVFVFMTFNFFFARWKQKFDIQVAAADSRTTGVLADSITNQNAISLFTGYARETDYFREVTEDQARKTRFAWNLGDIVDMVQVFLIYVVEFVTFYYAILYWEQGQVTVGTFVLVQVYIIGLSQQLWGFNRIIRGIYESIADSREMVEILHTPYEIQDVPGAKKLKVTAGEIVFNKVSFNFHETRPVLRDISLTIRPGEKVALVGPSGAGKTTFVRLILRLYDSTSGNISIDGQDVVRVTQESLRAQVSLVPQDPVLFHRSLLENIRYGRFDATDEEVLAAAKLAHCDEFIEELPDKYETFVGERRIKLSGGERQRVAIARAILKNAPILILDEATSSLDSHSEALIQDALDTLMRGRTTIAIAHRLSTIRKMDRIIVLENGVVLEQGTHEELVGKEGSLYKKLWELQAGGFIK